MHPLMQTTRRTAADPELGRPNDAAYDFSSGMWTGSKGPLCDDPEHIPQSKKNDMETGEDQKGQ